MTSVPAPRPPRRGDIGVCCDCTAILLVEADGATKLRHITADEFRELAAPSVMLGVLLSVRAIQEENRKLGRPSQRWPHVRRFQRLQGPGVRGST